MTTILSQRIKELRDENGWKQEHLAKLLGLSSKSSICNYESGYSMPTGPVIENLAQIFDVTVNYLTGTTDLKERYIKFLNGSRMPVFKSQDTHGVINKEYSNIECYIELADCINIRRGDFLGVVIDDNGIDKLHINKNDIVVVSRCQIPESGSLCALIVDNHITVRRYFTDGDTVTLVPESTDEGYISKKYKKDAVSPIGNIIKAIINIHDF